MNWKLKKFDELSIYELYAIIHLRNEVFVVEQNCVYQDADHKDIASYHFTGWSVDDKLVAYSRIVPPGITYAEPSIGRVVTSLSVRNTGVGKELLEKSIEQITKLYGNIPIKIAAQVYILTFYTSLGFKQTGNIYLEDNIEHVEMTLQR